jgi:hypothetical protein
MEAAQVVCRVIAMDLSADERHRLVPLVKNLAIFLGVE